MVGRPAAERVCCELRARTGVQRRGEEPKEESEARRAELRVRRRDEERPSRATSFHGV